MSSQTNAHPIGALLSGLPAAAQPCATEAFEHQTTNIGHDFSATWRVFKVILGIVGVMAVSAALVSAVVLKGPLVMLGACVAFAMMLFIGLPLILASVGDVTAEE
jgi:hypothetical protein